MVVVGRGRRGLWGLQRANDFESLARAGKADAKDGSAQPGGQAGAGCARVLPEGEGRVRPGTRACSDPEWVRGPAVAGPPAQRRRRPGHDRLRGIHRRCRSGTAPRSRPSGHRRRPLNQLLRLSRPHLDAALVSLVAVAGRSAATSALMVSCRSLPDAVTEMQEELAAAGSLILHRSQSTARPRALPLQLPSTGSSLAVAEQRRAAPDGRLPRHLRAGRVRAGRLRADQVRPTSTPLPRDTLDLPLPVRRAGECQPLLPSQDANWWIDFPTRAEVMNTVLAEP